MKDAGALSPAQESALRSRQDLIVAEASTLLANEWAGTYGAEDGLTAGARLDWAPANGFLIWWTTCSHQWRERVNFGSVDLRDGNLRLRSELGREGEKVYALPGYLIPVKWGEQHYLVPLDRLIAFCYAARNAGRSYEIDEFFLKLSDRDKRRFGLPAVPLHYKKYLVGTPIQAMIVEVKPQPEPWLNTFTLNVGRRAGVVPGMKFFAIFPGNVYMLVEVISVRDNDSEAYVMTSRFKNHSDREVKPRVGWKLTSRAPRSIFGY
ncbi:MAG TPA: hypothetical protein VF088_17130 [Pyrinomonadaceae bacterium]